MRWECPDDRDRHLATETIYEAIDRPELGGLCRGLAPVLRTRRRRRRPHRRADARRISGLVGMRIVGTVRTAPMLGSSYNGNGVNSVKG